MGICLVVYAQSIRDRDNSFQEYEKVGINTVIYLARINKHNEK